jgi:hypothetical protein
MILLVEDKDVSLPDKICSNISGLFWFLHPPPPGKLSENLLVQKMYVLPRLTLKYIASISLHSSSVEFVAFSLYFFLYILST